MPDTATTLGEVALLRTTLEAACGRCGRLDNFFISNLVDQYGSDLPLAALLRIVADDCARMVEGDSSDVCGIHFRAL